MPRAARTRSVNRAGVSERASGCQQQMIATATMESVFFIFSVFVFLGDFSGAINYAAADSSSRRSVSGALDSVGRKEGTRRAGKHSSNALFRNISPYRSLPRSRAFFRRFECRCRREVCIFRITMRFRTCRMPAISEVVNDAILLYPPSLPPSLVRDGTDGAHFVEQTRS